MHDDLGTLNFDGNCLLSYSDLCCYRAAFIDGFVFKKSKLFKKCNTFKKKKVHLCKHRK